jgi:hypothetical protein
MLNVGQSYEDAAAGIVITVLSIDATGASVSVTFGSGSTPTPACANANPTINMSPSAAWVVGMTANYTVTVTNNDSSVCAPSTFNLAASLPAGWSAAFGALAPLAPGGSSSTSLQLSAAAGAADGYYSFSVTARNAAAPSYAASASATEVCCSGALIVQAATDKASYLRNSVVTITVSSAVGQSPAASVSVTVKIVQPSGASATYVATTGSNGMAVVKYKLAAKAAIGTYAVAATANSGGYSGVASAAFNVTSK